MSAYAAVLGTQRRLMMKFVALGLPPSSIQLTGNAKEGYRIEVLFRSEADKAKAGLGNEYEDILLDIKMLKPLGSD
jgi:hypothetical protein